MTMATMTTEEIFKFLELYQSEPCLWNPKNKNNKHKNATHDAWNRISVSMGIPVHELKKKRENLMSTFRINLKRKIMFSMSGTEDVYKPVWTFYEAMESFLKDVYEASFMNATETEDQTQSDLLKERIPSVHADDLLSTREEIQSDEEIISTPQKKPKTQPTKRPVLNAPTALDAEFQEPDNQISSAFISLTKALTAKVKKEDEDETDLFCKMLSKMIKGYPKLEREEIMYEIHGVMINKRRRYERIKQIGSNAVSSGQVIPSSPSYKETYSPNYESSGLGDMSQNVDIREDIKLEISEPETVENIMESESSGVARTNIDVSKVASARLLCFRSDLPNPKTYLPKHASTRHT